jgi:hypothetical protein
VQSLILASILIIASMLIFVMGIISYSISDLNFKLKNINNNDQEKISYKIID